MFTKSKASEEDAEPIDLLLDTLIALLDKGSGGLRSLANMVLALSAPALTSSSIEHLLAVSPSSRRWSIDIRRQTSERGLVLKL